MTVIVALKQQGKLWFGYDGMISNRRGEGEPIDNRKAIRMLDADGLPWLIGGSGEILQLQLIEGLIRLPGNAPERKSNIVLYLTNNFIPVLRSCLVGRGAMPTGKDGREKAPCDLVIGVSGQICTIDEDFQIIVPHDPYTAIGSGGPTALPALASTSNLISDPKKRIARVLRVTAKYCKTVGGRFRIINSDGEEVSVK